MIPESSLQRGTGGTLETDLGEAKHTTRVALTGADFRRVNFELLCQEGEQVKLGAAIMRDTRRPAIVFTAPVAGTIVRVERGSRRRLKSLQIEVEDTLDSVVHDPPVTTDQASLRAFLLKSGVWTALRTRPYGNIPDPESEPAALFITALDSEPLAPDPKPVIENFGAEFRAGVAALSGICNAPVYVCHSLNYAPPIDTSERVRGVAFSAGASSGLPGVHINTLCPIGFGGGEVWHIGYQEVISLGHLMQGGTAWIERIISIAGNAVQHPRCLRVFPGSSIGELVADELRDSQVRIFSGSFLRGQVVDRINSFLAAGHRQLTVLSESDIETRTSPLTGQGVLIPSDELELLAPPGIYPVPLMRALQVGDVDHARDLGALELVEEDLALLSYACLSQTDYGVLLRNVLDQLEEIR